MVLTPEEQAIIEERFEALEEKTARFERLLRSGRAFTNNPLSLATDLDDLGSVKTHLDFEEAPLTPVNPQAEVGRIFGVGRTGVNDTSLRYIDKDGNVSEVTHPPAVYARRDGAQDIPGSTWTAVQFDTADTFDTDDMHSTSTNNTRVTAKTAGVYSISCLVFWQANTTSIRRLRILRGGSETLHRITIDATASAGADMGVHTFFSLAVDDYVELELWHAVTGGGGLNVDNGRLAMVWVAPTP